jgi:hypothetical protein
MKTPNSTYPLFIFFILIFIGCNVKGYEFSEVKHHNIQSFDYGFKEYCRLDFNSNFEWNAVQCSFYGDYQNAIEQATKRASFVRNPFEDIVIEPAEIDKEKLVKALNSSLNDSDASLESKEAAQKALKFLSGPKTTEELFSEARPLSAISYISNKAKEYHFTLINEAHYNSQHRFFTKELLRPLWKEGYRCLALETLYHTDTGLYERGYPVLSSGYYTKDSNFGNLIREAIEIGYTLIPYETQNKHDGTLRDADQATNIYRQTLQEDKKGKVLIHAGYSHISEIGGVDYEPRGLQLKRLAKQDILTIDQVRMTGLSDLT